MNIIKRYSNRKLYSTADHGHITHMDLFEMVRRGEEFSVVDGSTGVDITQTTLQSAVFGYRHFSVDELKAMVVGSK